MIAPSIRGGLSSDATEWCRNGGRLIPNLTDRPKPADRILHEVPPPLLDRRIIAIAIDHLEDEIHVDLGLGHDAALQWT
jgi:hypothetical protein